MKRPSCPIKLTVGATNQLVDATLFEGLSKENIDDHEKKWIPILSEVNKTAKINSPRLPIAEDGHWRWSQKAIATAGQLAYRHYAIEYNESTEGLMMVSLVGYQSKLEPPKDILYIDYLAVAPNNREVIQSPPHLKGIGSILFHYAIKVASEEGINGRVGLHSLYNSAPWYHRLGLTSFGKDPSCQNLEYFELSEKNAQKILQELATK